MKFKVTGSNKQTGARMSLEFEAESKAAAERKALTMGMNVNRVEDITDGETAHAMEGRPTSKNRGKGGGMMKWVILIVAVAVAYFYYSKFGLHLPG